MLQVHNQTSTTIPIVAHGRTVSFVSRTRGLEGGGDGWSFVLAWSTPHHVEVLDQDGRRRVVPIHDRYRSAAVVLGVAGAACLLGARALRWRFP